MIEPELAAEAERRIAMFLRQKARSHAAGPLRRDDRHDLTQVLRLAVVKSLVRFDPAKGRLAAFLDAVIGRAFLSAMRDRFARRRDPRRVRSLDRLIDAAGSPPPDHRRPAPPDHRRAVELRLDVADAVAGLGPEDRALAEQLMIRRPADAARALGLSWADYLARLRRLRKALGGGPLAVYASTNGRPSR